MARTPEEQAKWVEHQVTLLGIRPGDALWEEATDAAKRGWPAWRIAQAYDLGPDLIRRLGGYVR